MEREFNELLNRDVMPRMPTLIMTITMISSISENPKARRILITRLRKACDRQHCDGHWIITANAVELEAARGGE